MTQGKHLCLERSARASESRKQISRETKLGSIVRKPIDVQR